MLERKINMEVLHQTVNAIGCLQEAGNLDKAHEVYYELGVKILQTCGVELEHEPNS